MLQNVIFIVLYAKRHAQKVKKEDAMALASCDERSGRRSRQAPPLTWETVRAALVSREPSPRVLMVLDDQKRAPYGKWWRFPGGSVESGETPEMALLREVKEEAGILLQGQDLRPLGKAGFLGRRNASLLYVGIYGAKDLEYMTGQVAGSCQKILVPVESLLGGNPQEIKILGFSVDDYNVLLFRELWAKVLAFL